MDSTITQHQTDPGQFSAEVSKRASNSIPRRSSRGQLTSAESKLMSQMWKWNRTMKHPFIVNAGNIMWSLPFQLLSFAFLCCLFTIIPLVLCGLAAYAIVFVYRMIILAFSHKRSLPVSKDHLAVVITGCSSGIGFDAAIRLASLGFTVFATVRKDQDGDRLVKAFKDSQETKQKAGTQFAVGTIVPLMLEVTSTNDIQQCVKTVQDYLDKRMAKDARLIGLINNASVGEYSPIELLKADQLRNQFDVNVVSYVAISQAFLPLLRKNNNQPSGNLSKHSSRLIFISSGLAHFTMGGTGAYSASKHALNSIVDAFRTELRKWDIVVTAICPGLIDTPFHSKADERRSKTLQSAERGEREYGETARANKAANQFSKRNPNEVVQQYAIATRIANLKGEIAGKLVNRPHLVSDCIQMALLDTRPLPYYFGGIEIATWPLMSHLPVQFIDWIYHIEWLLDWTKWGQLFNKRKGT